MDRYTVSWLLLCEFVREITADIEYEILQMIIVEWSCALQYMVPSEEPWKGLERGGFDGGGKLAGIWTLSRDKQSYR